MDLNFKSYGQGDPLIILHGLFGMLDNWHSLGKRFAEHHTVFLVDQRNHGRSPHADEMDYRAMAEDLRAFMEQNWIYHAHILGHSMGGKTAMQLALDQPDLVDRLVVVDIAPKSYPERHNQIFDALMGLSPGKLDDRRDADEKLQAWIGSRSIRQFLLKNLVRDNDQGYRFKMNLPVIYDHYEDLLAAPEPGHPFEKPALFIRGGRSEYIQDEDRDTIFELFPNAHLETIEKAGHWVHAEAPDQLFELVTAFLDA